jgi:hypothetical protein
MEIILVTTKLVVDYRIVVVVVFKLITTYHFVVKEITTNQSIWSLYF